MPEGGSRDGGLNVLADGESRGRRSSFEGTAPPAHAPETLDWPNRQAPRQSETPTGAASHPSPFIRGSSCWAGAERNGRGKPILVLLVPDLRERAMLGDTGAGAVGAVAGLWIVLTLPVIGRGCVGPASVGSPSL